MKILKAATFALAVTVAFGAGKALAVSIPTAQTTLFKLNISGTMELQKTNETKIVKSGTNYDYVYVGVIESKSFGNAQLYLLVSNAVAADYGDYAPATNLPADGYIAFNSAASAVVDNSSYNTIYGTLYVTNKSGFYYPLQGTYNGAFYSYLELDYEYYGFDDLFDNDIYAGTYNEDTSTGTYTETGPMYLYFNDDPYYYDGADNPMNFNDFDNDSVELHAVLHDSQTYRDDVLTHESLSSFGGATGDAYIDDNYGIIINAHVSLVP
ncbi:MAG: hypothetical protein ACREE6_18510 [Limisphaerales bacterium]